ncbi:septal ring lytic transglycosylase RlpA family protein [Sediminibacterium sp.]|uniref:septal ring lytic transglycosylase RlpA family protein n=1 Tax=Sediminibacterium sp. TaxID=1917865 RepID=UPI0025E91201|nr:septal ring lytic transglycosylase RlpA family protein [Sediminibacterium sp.]MBW0178294.1 septal ring lytic transglycosylase RlpA family protein [Sediminibacterium sp.]
MKNSFRLNSNRWHIVKRFCFVIAVILIGSGCSRKITESGMASFYGAGDGYNGRKTANGETFNKNKLTAAHKTLPFGTIVKVKNLGNGQTVKVRINDRGPFVKGRIIDLSEKAAKKINMRQQGVAEVTLKYRKK